MRSKNGLIFGVINIIGNFATVFEDQHIGNVRLRVGPVRPSMFTSSVVWRGMSGFCEAFTMECSFHDSPRFAIPFTMATTMGLAAVATRGDPDMRILSPADVSAGLPASAVASALLGKGGAAALLVLLFLAVTSATSAELIAVSSILTYDAYKASPYTPR